MIFRARILFEYKLSNFELKIWNIRARVNIERMTHEKAFRHQGFRDNFPSSQFLNVIQLVSIYTCEVCCEMCISQLILNIKFKEI